ncbi:hypothetical protein BURK1_02021 [Burkholderiales bacterium]|nr:hypothetical protein BURK1_02021 [Burkholderiales bacterium]
MNAPSYFVWYRLAGDACEARSAVTAMMLDVAIDCGVVGRLMKRADDPSTWMEVYEAVDDPDAFEHALAEALARHGTADYADGGRHVERFVACGALDGE